MNISKLKSVLPNDIFTELSTVLSTRTLTLTQLAQFLANAAHESAGWTKYLENMNYRAERLLVVFPKYFKNLADAKAVVAQGQEAIGNRVYANRMGNNSTNGYFYRGRGVFQLTGKNNYSLFDATVIDDITNNPDLVLTKYKVTSAFWFMDYNGLWLLANKTDCTPLRKRINGGVNGLKEVQNYFNKYLPLIS